MPTVYVNDTPVEIGADKLNCVTAAAKAGVEVPHYCYHPALTVVASCRMCLVEVGELKDGKVTMQPKVSPGCQTPVRDGTVVVTGDYVRRDGVPPLPYDLAYKPGEKAKKSQADTLEGLLLNHPLDCPVASASCKIIATSTGGARAGWSTTSCSRRTSRASARKSRSSRIAASCAAGACGSPVRCPGRPNSPSSAAATTPRSTCFPAGRSKTS